MDQMMIEFLAESVDALESMDQDFLRLEDNTQDSELVHSVFRKIHTIKGTCGFFGLSRLESISHCAENVLDMMRDGKLPIDTSTIDPILTAVDVMKGIVQEIQSSGVEPVGDDSSVISALQKLLDASGAPVSAAATAEPVDEIPAISDVVVDMPMDEPGEPPATDGKADTGAEEESLEDLMNAIVPVAKKTAPKPATEAAVAAASAAPAQKSEMPGATTEGSSTAASAAPSSSAPKEPPKETSLRVNLDVLERIMNLVGELVLTRNRLLQLSQESQDRQINGSIQNLDFITSDLQDAVMKTRMQPISNAWSKLPRIVRDIAKMKGKKVNIIENGKDTELDRQVLQAIQDPLTHMVRNSVDHGLETPDKRVAIGKPEVGTLELSAFHEGGYIIIEISDDGGGIDSQRILNKALEKGIVTERDAASMTKSQMLNLIFAPGLSTAEQVTNISGRGVGMDVVRRNIENIGGDIEIESDLGKGTKFRIKIPLTLAIISAITFRCGSEIFAIPQICVAELVRVDETNEQQIQRLVETPMLKLRDRLLPLIYLDKTLKLADSVPPEEREETTIIVINVSGIEYGLVVDEVQNTQEIVVKSSGRLIRNIALFSGTTILGDGRVVMIIDPQGVADHLGIRKQGEIIEEVDEAAKGRISERERLLLFRAQGGALTAVPLGLVSRLEEIPSARIEKAGNYVVQYRGNLLPLITCDEQPLNSDKEIHPVIVFSEGDLSMGLVVDRIEDIVEDSPRTREAAGRPGMLGAGIVAGKATEIIDTYYFVQKAYPDWFNQAKGKPTAKNRPKALLLDDSRFYLEILRTLVEGAGFETRTASLPSEALAILEDGFQCELIISDIEMPEMNGTEFITEVNKRFGAENFYKVAVTGRHGDVARNNVLKSGFDQFAVKQDRAGLMDILNKRLTAA